MPAKIVLTVTEGPLAGRSFTYEERTTCIVGRAGDCDPRLPSDDQHQAVSRHHCLLDINPPDIRVRDFGSLNGTFVNGRKIGQRDQGLTPEQAAQMQFPEHDLTDGDVIRIAQTAFRVGVVVRIVCEGCGAEVATGAAAAPGLTGPTLCSDCFRRGRAAAPAKPRLCAKCGKDVSQEAGQGRQGEYVCASCQADPLAILRRLLDNAKSGEQGLASIRGYAIERELGRGGMGAVYLARREGTGQQVALKVMLPKVALDERSKEMFLRETENTQALRHPNIASLLDHGCSDGSFFLTLEFCDGGSVDGLMDRRGGILPTEEAVRIALQALDALDYAHNAEVPHVKLAGGGIGRGRGLVHRDIKPQNILLAGHGGGYVAKVTDFGLAKAFDTAGLSGQTRTGSAAGTPCFMPRQQVISFKYAKPEVDVWAIAATLYTMLTGAFPRDFPRGVDPWAAVLKTAPVPIRQRLGSIPPKLAEVIDAALVDNPQIHFQTASQLKQALRSAQ